LNSLFPKQAIRGKFALFTPPSKQARDHFLVTPNKLIPEHARILGKAKAQSSRIFLVLAFNKQSRDYLPGPEPLQLKSTARDKILMARAFVSYQLPTLKLESCSEIRKAKLIGYGVKTAY
jgi:hypothetical protein